MIIALVLVGYEMIIVNSMLHASLAIHLLTSNLHSWKNYLASQKDLGFLGKLSTPFRAIVVML